MPAYSIGVDLGGTNLRAAVVSSAGEVLAKVAGRTQLSEGRDAVIADIVRAIEAIAVEHPGEELAGVGIGIPGFIEIERGYVAGSSNLPFFDNFPVRDAIEQRLGTRVILENDANAAALGEYWMGAGRGEKNLILLTLGTGIGGGIIADGRVLHGQVGMAGEFGHMTVYPNGNPCGCGNYGCLERHASASFISGMARTMNIGENLTAEQVFRKAEAGDERARMIFVSMGRALGIALGNLINAFNYPLYLLSGGPLPAWELFAPSMMAEIERRSFAYRNVKTRIEKAILGNEAGLFGAAYLPLQLRT